MNATLWILQLNHQLVESLRSITSSEAALSLTGGDGGSYVMAGLCAEFTECSLLLLKRSAELERE